MRKFVDIIIFIVIFLILTAGDIFARVGGAGGSGGSSGGSGGGYSGSSSSNSGGGSNPEPVRITIFISVVVFLLFLSFREQRNKKRKTTQYHIKRGQKPIVKKKIKQFQQENPEFNVNKFITNVHIAFYNLQHSWSKKELQSIRIFITDGMYQKLNTQLTMMDKLDQTNVIEFIDITNAFIADIETDGLLDIIHVGIAARIKDHFISKKYPKFNSGGQESFIEYWTFIKKKGAKDNDLSDADECPNCGAGLSKSITDITRCSHCKALINSGEYGWILSEITQSNYFFKQTHSNQNKKINEFFSLLNGEYKQQIEDKASNAFFQVCTARVLKNTDIIKRFVSNDYFNTISEKINQEDSFVYNRIFTNMVNITSAKLIGDEYVVTVKFNYSYQKIWENNGSINKYDKRIKSHTIYVILARKISTNPPKGSLYDHECPSCGSLINDTTDIKCQYCGIVLNSNEYDWIVKNITKNYRTYLNKLSK